MVFGRRGLEETPRATTSSLRNEGQSSHSGRRHKIGEEGGEYLFRRPLKAPRAKGVGLQKKLEKGTVREGEEEERTRRTKNVGVRL